MVDHTAEEMSNNDITEVSLDIDNILLATDGSKYSVKATKTAIALAKLVNAKVTATFVDTGKEDAWLPEENLQEEVQLGVHPSEAGLEIAKKFGKKNGVEVSTTVLKGGVTKEIVYYARNHDIDLIIIGESGRTGLARIALGSVAESVTKASDVPVLVSK
ncbi:universal stress protein [Selenihalanaerobacter shriftii]|uniref:Nucleotide-binding universal stress protein, UspA family n=1 Tax=Selenihalanaerobacter shriftii TaxID=142842 RepID=A0A1T4JQ68_9FIRM|nr:universal stress protein [Selenihalanaerobacter shriftii]SJZ32261.1 Nucleotide-binding universal stress protein, UspA family [Selenihalanaerobacter shriftii]